jgi:hypothetical protein
VAKPQGSKLLASAAEESIGTDDKRLCLLLRDGSKRRFDLGLGAGLENARLKPERGRRRLQAFRDQVAGRIGRIDQQRKSGCAGDKLVEQLKPFRPQLCAEGGCAREVAAWPVQARNEPGGDRVGAH